MPQNTSNQQKDALPPQTRGILPMARLTNLPPKQNTQGNANG